MGSAESGQLKAHLDLMYKKCQREIPSGIVGDICSRLFNKEAGEIDETTGDKFVAISFKWLNFLARIRGRRVIAIAGGMKKLPAIHALLSASVRRESDRLFNVLVTDELTARILLRSLAND